MMRDLGTLGGPDSSAAFGCNNQRDDLVVGSSLLDSIPNNSTGFPTQHAFLWENGTMTDIPTLGGTFASAQCANNQGQVIGQSNLAGDVDQHAFFWDHETLTDLGTLGGSSSIAFWLNNLGEAVGAANTPDDESFHATLWRNGQITDLGTLPGDCLSIAFGINSKEQVVGQSFSCDGGSTRAFLWDKGMLIDLSTTGAEEGKENINDRGEIAGVGLPPGCNEFDICSHAFLLIPCGQGCAANSGIGTPSADPTITTSYATPSQRRQMTKEFVARLRSRLAQRTRTLATAKGW